MKETEKTKDIPVIIMSADNDPDIVSECLKNGAKDFLSKPIKLAVRLNN